jgi:Glycosyltransferase 61
MTILALVPPPLRAADDLAEKVLRRATLRLQAGTSQLRNRRLLPGIAAPTEVRSLSDWTSTEAAEDLRVHPLGSEQPAIAHDGRTVGEPNEAFSASRAKPPSPLWLLSIPDGRLATESGVAVTSNGCVVVETAWDLEQLELSLPPGTRLPRPIQIRGAHASLISLWSENYFHWLLDAIPRYAVLERSGLAPPDVGLVVPERLSAFQEESLTLLGIPPKRRTPFRRSHIQAETLLVPSSAARTGNPAPWVVRWLRDRLGAQHVEQCERRLYVTRARARTRRIADEERLWRILRDRGFERVSPEMISLSQQIRLFAESRIVVGPHGAAHSNTLFSQNLTLVELFPSDYVNRCNLALADAAGHDYWYLIGTRSEKGCFSVPLDAVEATLDAVL